MGNTEEFDSVMKGKCAPLVHEEFDFKFYQIPVESRDLIIQFAQMVGYFITCLVKSLTTTHSGGLQMIGAQLSIL